MSCVITACRCGGQHKSNGWRCLYVQLKRLNLAVTEVMAWMPAEETSALSITTVIFSESAKPSSQNKNYQLYQFPFKQTVFHLKSLFPSRVPLRLSAWTFLHLMDNWFNKVNKHEKRYTEFIVTISIKIKSQCHMHEDHYSKNMCTVVSLAVHMHLAQVSSSKKRFVCTITRNFGYKSWTPE
jgi:hypothetical protein